MADPFETLATGMSGPAENAYSITPADSDLATVTRALWVGGGGTLSVILAGDTAAVTLTHVPSGTLLPIRAKQVRSTSTTATSIVGLY